MTALIPKIASSEITARETYFRRREFLQGAAAAALLTGAAARAGAAPLTFGKSPQPAPDGLTAKGAATSYNNYYEFGTGKDDPARYAGALKTSPWAVEVGGLVAKPKTFDLDELLKLAPLEERIHRLRCVEAWSMVIPWIGFPLSALLTKVEPLGSAKFVAFETVVRPSEMRGQRGLFQSLEWPYIEGLRIDEAGHPLTILAVGMYGETLPNQNGAPIRLVVPWKYGFKNIKSIVRINLVEKQPQTSWNLQAPDEYGFYANVNPDVDHPRWSQNTERRITGGSSLITPRVPTLPFNGYGEQVASLYAGMDLTVNY